MNITVIERETGKKVVVDLTNGVDRAIIQVFKSQAPTRKGDLKNLIRIETFDGGFRIVSDIYYMPFTNEKWVHPRWRWPNPNEGWWDEAFDIAMRFLSSMYGKEFRREQ